VNLTGALADPERSERTGLRLDYSVNARIVGGSGPKTAELDLVVSEGTGLVPVSDARYEGSFELALFDPQRPYDTRSLEAPLRIAVTAPNATLSTSDLSLRQIGQWTPVDIEVNDPTGERYTLTFRVDPADTGDEVGLPVHYPHIDATSNPASIVGWGIGRSQISIDAPALAGSRAFSVRVSSTRGVLTPSSVVLDDRGHGVVELRSSGYSSAEVAVSFGSGYETRVDVPFEPPWIFLGAGALGGLVGSVLSRRGRSKPARAAAIGTVTGVLMTVAYAVGIDWTSEVLPGAHLANGGEAVVIVLGAVGAMVGVNRLLPTPDPAGSS